MSDDAAVFEKLEVLRAPGFEKGGFSVGELSPGINVIYGPNASGKTTMARAIQTLLWAQRPELGRAELVGHLRAEQTHWRVGFDRGRASFQREGIDSEAGPQTPPAEQRDRYYLSLHELLEANNASLASFIVNESAGGYDVGAARQNLGYSLQTPRKGQATKDVEKAKKAVRVTESEQGELHQEEQELFELRRKLERAESAASRVELLRLACDFREAEATREDAAEQLENFPQAIELVQGDEMRVLEKQRRLVREATSDEAQARKTIGECEVDLEASPVPENGLPAGLLATLDGYVLRIDELQRDKEVLRVNLAKAVATRDSARRALGAGLTPENAPPIDAESLHAIARVARKADQIRGKRTAYARLEELFSSAEVPEHLEQVREGMRALHRWLSSQRPERAEGGGGDIWGTARLVALGSAVAVALVSTALGVLIHLAWLALLVLAAVLIWLFVLLQPFGAPEQNRRDVYRRDFEKSGAASPEAWNQEAVEAHLDRLAEQWASGRVEAEKAREWQTHSTAYEQVESLAEKVDADLARLSGQLGIAVDGEAELFLVASNVRAWQEASAEVGRVESQLERLDDEQQGLLEKLSTELMGYNLEAVFDASQAKARVTALREASHEFEALQARLESARTRLEQAEHKEKEASDTICKLFERLELEPGDERALLDLCERRPHYDRARDKHVGAESTALSEQRRLKSHPEYTDKLLEMSVSELRAQAEDERQEAAKKDGLIKSIQDIETKIEQAKKSHRVEEKRAHYAAKLEELNRSREADYRRVVGAVLAEYVHEQTRDRERPQVFHRARELFSEITKGRYRLDFHDAERPEFSAWDTVQQVGNTLDQLSSATRVQLLLAVRVAFVEHQEQGLKLPLLLDETLANSDDERARAIIEAIARVGAQGRQIFYFTAQSDEVRKWRELLPDSELAFRFVDLGSITGTGAVDELYDEDILPPIAAEIPKPVGMSHAEYGEALGIGGALSPRAPIESVHLWYLVEEPQILYRLLEAGIRHWGQLRELARVDALGAVGLSEEQYTRVAARAKVLEAQAQAWAVGRGKPVTREALEASGAVADTFIDEVSQLCDRYEGDADRLLEALAQGEVSYFRDKKCEELEEYLQSRGYIDSDEPLSQRQIWSRVLSAVAAEMSRGLIDSTAIRRCMARAVGEH